MESRFLILIILCTQCCYGQSIEWKNYGNDPGGQRFADIDQITPQNVTSLDTTWIFRTGELERYQNQRYLTERAAFEATPIMVAEKLYFPTPSNQVFALNAQTGQELWRFDPKVDLFNSEFSEFTCRGVSYWTDGTEERLLMGTVDGRLCSIDAQNGRMDPKFGNEGYIDLKLGVGLVQVTSAPSIINDIVVVGTSIGDNNRTHDSRGVVRAFRIKDGQQVWSFDPIPTDPTDPAFKTWQNGSAYRTGAANVWATISNDLEHDLVFLPSSSPSPDFYGGERLGNNDYANSIIALKASTGAYQWHFQVVHHDIWDYDIAAQPVLFDYPSEGQSLPAIAIGTKMGHVFVLNRLTGEAILPYEEKPVPTSNVPGEVNSSTQPIPVRPAPLGNHHLTIQDAWGPMPDELEAAKADFASRRYEGIFTPPSTQGTLIAPGNIGGIHWGGMSYDSKRHLLITNINRLATLVQVHPRHEPEAYSKYLQTVQNDDNSINPETNRMLGTPYRMSRLPYLKATDTNVWGMTSPPWGTILAIDIRSGNKVWEKPLGYMGNIEETPDFKDYGSINLGGTCVTASGLTFVAATVDNHLRAFETATGQLLWEYPLPASGIATPMSYYINGKQYIVIAAGGHGKNSLTKMGDYVIAFALK